MSGAPPSPASPGWPQPICLDAVTSTMDAARARALAGAPHGTSVVAQAQSAGRGRSGSAWDSPAGAGLYATCILYVPQRPDVATLAPIFGLACAEAMDVLGVREPRVALKWPNDLLWQGRKLGGLLLQREAQGPTGCCLLLGIGINLTAATQKAQAQAQAQTAAAPRAPLPRTCLAAVLGRPAPPVLTVWDVVQRACARRYRSWLDHGLCAATRTAYDLRHVLRGRDILGEQAGGGEVFGTAQTLQPCGGLALNTARGPCILHAGATFALRPLDGQSPLLPCS